MLCDVMRMGLTRDVLYFGDSEKIEVRTKS